MVTGQGLLSPTPGFEREQRQESGRGHQCHQWTPRSHQCPTVPSTSLRLSPLEGTEASAERISCLARASRNCRRLLEVKHTHSGTAPGAAQKRENYGFRGETTKLSLGKTRPARRRAASPMALAGHPGLGVWTERGFAEVSSGGLQWGHAGLSRGCLWSQGMMGKAEGQGHVARSRSTGRSCGWL